MSKRCCKYHNNFVMAWIDADALDLQPTDLNDCGIAGPNAVTLCCKNCPLRDWYKENQPTRPVRYEPDMVAEFKREAEL